MNCFKQVTQSSICSTFGSLCSGGVAASYSSANLFMFFCLLI